MTAPKKAPEAEPAMAVLESVSATLPVHPQAEFTPVQMATLMNDIHPSRISNRKQGNTTLSYVEAHDIKSTLIRVFGFANFSADIIDAKVLKISEFEEQVMNWANGKPTGPKLNPDGTPVMKKQFVVLAQSTCRLTIHATGATYTETAAASQKGADIGEVTDFALKTSESDALKRAAIYLGTQFGLSLYADGALTDQIQRIYEPTQAAALEQGRLAYAQRAAAQQQAIAQGAPVSQGQQAPPTPQSAAQGQPRQAPPQGQPGAGRSAVSQAFAHEVKNAAGPSINSRAGVEHYTGGSYGDN